MNRESPSDTLKIQAMNSGEAERVQFSEVVDTKRDVEYWLLDVERVMRETLKDQLSQALLDLESAKREEWIMNWPGQAVLAVNQISFTAMVTRCLQKRDLRGLKILQAKLVEQLNRLTDLVSGTVRKSRKFV